MVSGAMDVIDWRTIIIFLFDDPQMRMDTLLIYHVIGIDSCLVGLEIIS
jgi:hypothetical protein